MGRRVGEEEQRNGQRIENKYLLHYRQHVSESSDEHWESSFTRNISKSGMLFNSSVYFHPGSELEIRIVNPLTITEQKQQGTVVRTNLFDEKQSIYETAVKINEIEDQEKAIFEESINFYLSI